MVHDEKGLSFSFEGWEFVVPYDKSPFHLERVVRALNGTKAVDFVGVREGRVYLIEVTDYRNAGEHDLRSGKVFCETGQKARDTFAAIVGSWMVGSLSEGWALRVAQILTDRSLGAPPVVVLWLESDALRSKRAPVMLAAWHRQLEKNTRWIARESHVAALARPLSNCGVVVLEQARAG